MLYERFRIRRTGRHQCYRKASMPLASLLLRQVRCHRLADPIMERLEGFVLPCRARQVRRAKHCDRSLYRVAFELRSRQRCPLRNGPPRNGYHVEQPLRILGKGSNALQKHVLQTHVLS